jgi:tetratricopeptide (TPR) repeat protein/tRNA A-37 threonylcarbamoyl transferase component Bud32
VHVTGSFAAQEIVAASGSTGAYVPAVPDGSPGRYVVKKFHARGGMGEVWLAEDKAIGRRVAMKTLRRNRSERHERFLAEAQITGQMEHPGIVPVHDLSTDDKGQPFYVMKFVEGRTLREAIADYHALKPAPPVQQEVQRIRLLEAFNQLCQTVAYAHSCGVIHRDLKPENVILGPYGETVVLDWGLAKVIGRPDPLGGTSSVRVSSGSQSETVDGSVIGTPAYMPPELASGHTTEADQRSDVYLLGATLYEILTGKPPREGSNQQEMIDLARTLTPVPPRKIKPDVPKPLEAICQRALAWRPQDRYASATEVADEVHRFLAGEAVLACPEGPAARLWRWCKRHRRLVGRTLTAAVFLGAALLIVGIVQEERNRLTATAAAAERETQVLRAEKLARQQAADFRRWAETVQFFAASTNPEGEHAPYFAPRQALQAGQKALELARDWGEDLQSFPVADERGRLKDELADLLLLLAQVGSRPAPERNAAESMLANLEWARRLGAPTRAYYRLSSLYHLALGEDAQAAEKRARVDDPNLPMTALDCFLLGEDARTNAVSISPRSSELPNWRPQRETMDQAVANYRLALEKNPQHYWAHYQLGRCLLSLGQREDALAELGACVVLAPDRPWGYSTRGLALALSGRTTEAARDLAHAVALDPAFLPARLNRGVVSWRQKKINDALADFSAVLDAPADRRLVEAAYYRGRIALEAGEYALALKDFNRVAQEKADFRPVYAVRAQIFLLQRQRDKALADIDHHLAIGQSLPKEAELHAQRGRLLRLIITDLPAGRRTPWMWQTAQAELVKAEDAGARSASMYNDLGVVLHGLGDSPGAIAAFSHGLERDPDNLVLRVNRAWEYVDASPDKAEEDFRTAARLSPRNTEIHTGLGYLMADAASKPDHKEAHVAAQREALEALRNAAGNHLVFHNVACIYGRLSQTVAGREKEYQDLTITVLKQAIELWREHGGPNEIDLINQEKEKTFSKSLKKRPEFAQLLRSGD